MSAVRHLPDVDAVIIDWVLEDAVDAESSGALDKLSELGIEYCIFTERPDKVTRWARQVIHKLERDGLENWINGLRGKYDL